MNGDSIIVEEVRQRRHAISERFGHDLEAYGKHLQELAAHYGDRVVSQITVVPARHPDIHKRPPS